MIVHSYFFRCSFDAIDNCYILTLIPLCLFNGHTDPFKRDIFLDFISCLDMLKKNETKICFKHLD
jgi:hypothetical protein